MVLQQAFTLPTIAATILCTLISIFLMSIQNKRYQQHLHDIEEGLSELQEFE